MAIVADLVARAGVDLSGWNRGIGEMVRSAGDLPQRMRQVIERRSLLPDMQQQGSRAADDMLRGIRQTFDARTATLRQQLVQQVISPEQFERRAAFAASRFNQQLLAGIAELRSRGLLSADLEQRLTAQLSELGMRAGSQTARTIAQGVAAYRGDMADAIRESLSRGVAEARRAVVQQVGTLMQGVGQQMRAVGQTLSLYVTAPLVAMGTLAVRAAADFERLEMSLSTVAGGAEAARGQIRQLAEIARLPGLGFREAIQGAVRLQAVGMSAETTMRSLEGFGRVVALTGGGAEQLDRVIYQLTQMVGKQRILMEDLRIMMDAAPALGRVLQEAFGTLDTEQIAKLGLSMDEILSRILDVAERLPRRSGGLANAFENLADAVYRARVRIGQEFAPAVAVLVDHFEAASERLQEMDRGLLQVALSVGVVAAAAAPVLLVLGTLTTAVGTAVLAFGGIPALIGTGVVAALGAIAAGFVGAKLDALAAAAAAREFTAEIAAMGRPDLQSRRSEIEQDTEAIRRQIAALEELDSRRPQVASGMGVQILTQEQQEIRRLRGELEERERQLREINEQMGQIVETTGELSGAVGGVDLGPLSTRVSTLISLFESLRSRGESTRAVANELEGVRAELESIAAAESDPFSEVRAGALALIERIRELSGGPMDGLRQSTQTVLSLYESIRERGGDISAAVSELYRLQGRWAQVVASQGGQMTELAAEAEAAAARIREALTPELRIRTEDFREELERVMDEARRFLERPLEIDLTVRASRTVQRGAEDAARFRQLDSAAEGARRAQQAAREVTQEFNETIQAANEVFSAFGDLADAADALGEGFSDALRGIETMLSGLSRIRYASALEDAGGSGLLAGLARVSGVLSIFAGGLSIASAIINRGAEERAREREEIRRTSEALARMQMELSGFAAGSGASIVAAQEVVREVLDLWQNEFTDAGAVIRNFDAILADAGISFQEFAAIAREAGLDIWADGKITRDELNALGIALSYAEEAVTRFTGSLRDQRTLMEAKRDIFDIEDTPQVRIQGELDLLDALAPELLDFLGLDQVNTAIPEELEAWVRRVFEMIEAGAIPAELLAQLPEGVRTLLEIILNIEGALDSLTDEVDRATQAFERLTNVPEIFDLAYRRRMAALDGVRTPRTEPPVGPRAGAAPIITDDRPGRGERTLIVNVNNPAPGVSGERIGQDVRRVIRDDPQVRAYIQQHARPVAPRAF